MWKGRYFIDFTISFPARQARWKQMRKFLKTKKYFCLTWTAPPATLTDSSASNNIMSEFAQWKIFWGTISMTRLITSSRDHIVQTAWSVSWSGWNIFANLCCAALGNWRSFLFWRFLLKTILWFLFNKTTKCHVSELHNLKIFSRIRNTDSGWINIEMVVNENDFCDWLGSTTFCRWRLVSESCLNIILNYATGVLLWWGI